MGMKLGTETGSLINHLYSRVAKGGLMPEVGMGVTELHWTDRSAGTIVEVFQIGGDVAIATTGDDYKIVSGSAYDGSAEYEYTSNPDGRRAYWRQTKDGWRKVYKGDSGRWLFRDKKGQGEGLIVGTRDQYYDPSF